MMTVFSNQWFLTIKVLKTKDKYKKKPGGWEEARVGTSISAISAIEVDLDTKRQNKIIIRDNDKIP